MISNTATKWIRNSVIITLLTFAFVGCNPARKALKSGDIEGSYAIALDYYNQENWSKASSAFESLVIYFKGGEREDSISYYNARSKFKNREYEDAIGLFEDYRRSYSRSPLLEEIEGMYTLSHYYLSPGPTRDQYMTQLAINKIDEYNSRYPSNRNFDEFLNIRKELVDRLYEKEYLDAYTYYKIGRYKSAITAMRNALKKFPESHRREDIVFYVLASNFELAENSIPSLQQQRYLSTIDAYYTFVAEFPESEYKSKAEKMFEDSKKFLDKNQDSDQTPPSQGEHGGEPKGDREPKGMMR